MMIPALGCGVAGFPLEKGAEIIGETIAEFEAETLEEVVFIAYSNGEYEAVERVTEPYRHEGVG